MTLIHEVTLRKFESFKVNDSSESVCFYNETNRKTNFY